MSFLLEILIYETAVLVCYQDVINSIGGVQVLFPLLECVDGPEGPDLSLLSPQTSSPSHNQDMTEWAVLPTSNLSGTQIVSREINQIF